MIWILASRGAATKLRASPFTETAIEGVHGVVYRPGIQAVPFSGGDETEGLPGTFARGLHRLSGVLYTFHGTAAESLLSITAGIDLWVRYRATGQNRVRKLKDVLFVGDATVQVPSLNRGLAELIGVPFRLQIPLGETLAQHVEDVAE